MDKSAINIMVTNKVVYSFCKGMVFTGMCKR